MRRTEILLMARESAGPNAPSRVLSASRFVVHPVRSQAEAQRLVLHNPQVGVAVLELQGDGVSGADVCAALRQALLPDRELAVVFLARSPSVNDVVRALRLEAVDLLRSPIEAPHLVDAVERAETLMGRRMGLRQGAFEMRGLVEAMRVQAAAMADTVRLIAATPGVGRAQGAVEFTEQLEAHAGREDTSSLAYTQRQRRRVVTAIRAQTVRREVLGLELAGDPCWDMLLDLYEKSLMGRSVSVSTLCNVAGVPATTALRRLEDMVTARLITRVRDSDDARRVLVQLTDLGTQKLRSYFDATASGV